MTLTQRARGGCARLASESDDSDPVCARAMEPAGRSAGGRGRPTRSARNGVPKKGRRFRTWSILSLSLSLSLSISISLSLSLSLSLSSTWLSPLDSVPGRVGRSVPSESHGRTCGHGRSESCRSSRPYGSPRVAGRRAAASRGRKPRGRAAPRRSSEPPARQHRNGRADHADALRCGWCDRSSSAAAVHLQRNSRSAAAVPCVMRTHCSGVPARPLAAYFAIAVFTVISRVWLPDSGTAAASQGYATQPAVYCCASHATHQLLLGCRSVAAGVVGA